MVKHQDATLDRTFAALSDPTRRALLSGGAGLAGCAAAAGAPSSPAARPKYYHVSQSSINYQAEIRSGKMDIFSFMDTCQALDLDGVDIHVGQLKSQTDRAHLKEVRRGSLNRGLPIASICVSTEYGRSAEAIPKELEKARLAMEAFTGLRVAGQRCGKRLDSNGPIETRVPGAIDLTHPARADLRRHFIRAEASASSQRHGVWL